jgi:hypothetical protein
MMQAPSKADIIFNALEHFTNENFIENAQVPQFSEMDLSIINMVKTTLVSIHGSQNFVDKLQDFQKINLEGLIGRVTRMCEGHPAMQRTDIGKLTKDLRGLGSLVHGYEEDCINQSIDEDFCKKLRKRAPCRGEFAVAIETRFKAEAQLRKEMIQKFAVIYWV